MAAATYPPYPALGAETGVLAPQYAYADVRRYGAVGDGSTDDRSAFANADASAAALGQGAIKIPSGLTCKIASNLTLSSACWFESQACVRPTDGVTITFNGPVATVDKQHCDLSAGGRLEPRSSFRRFTSGWGDSFDVFALGESGGTHPIRGEFDMLFGEHDEHVRRFEFHAAGPRVLSASLYAGTIGSVDTQKEVFSVNGPPPFSAGAYAPVHDVVFLVRFTSGAAATPPQNPYRWIKSNTGSQITLGLPTIANLAANDGFEILSLSLGSGARQPALILWHQEADDLTPGLEKMTARFGEAEINSGWALTFSRFTTPQPPPGNPGGPIARKLIDVVPLGTRGGGGTDDGVYDVHFLEDSSLYRNVVWNLPDRPNALRWFKDHRAFEFSAGIRFSTRRVTATGGFAATDYIILCDMTTAAYDFYLPDAAIADNRVCIIKKDDGGSNTLTVRSSGGNIDGSSSLALSTAYASAQFVSCNGTWHRIG